MARKTSTVTIATEGRDMGRPYLIREMLASQAERWAERLLFSPGPSGRAIPADSLGTGCAAIKAVTVNGLPPVIGGPSAVCLGGTITLTAGVPGGTWSRSNPAIAAVTPTKGWVSGVKPDPTSIASTLGHGLTGRER